MLFANDNLEVFYFRQAWPAWLLFLLIVGGLGFSILLYFREQGLAIWKRIFLITTRTLMLAVLFLLLFEPVGAQTKKETLASHILVLLDVSKSMDFADYRQHPKDLEDAALALGKLKFTETAMSPELRAEVTKPTRFEMARGILENPELAVFQKPGDKYRQTFFAFGDRLEAVADDAEKMKAWLKTAKANAPGTFLGEGLQQSVDKFSGQPLAAVIVLSDGASNGGIDPLDAARNLHVPVFTIPIGLPKPDDIRIVTVTVPDAVFPKDKVPVQVQLEATPGFVNKAVELTLKVDDRVIERKQVTLKNSQFEEMSFIPDKKAGLMKVEVDLAPQPGEAIEENNHAARSVKLIDEKIRVLYVEGKPRWEFRYLRAVLDRDHRMVVKYLMQEGDPELASERGDPKRYVSKLPETEAETFLYDMVILGDVKADSFTPAQLEWLEKLVRDKGGSLLMLAGRQYAPMTYKDTPIARLLPVKLAAGGRDLVDPTVHPVPTADGARSQIMDVVGGEGGAENERAWSVVKPLHSLPRLAGPQRGATVLATLSNQADRLEPYPLIAWQRYGSGKTMFVGSDQLWRLRFKRGDEYHAHVWSQTIQFLTLSRLLGENKRIRIETDRKLYQTGERVLIQAALLDEDYKPLKAPAFPVLIEQVPPQGQPRAVNLKPVAGQEGIYQAYIVADQPGNFQVTAPTVDDKDASKPNYQVETISREDLERDTQYEQLKKLSELTGGKTVPMRDLPKLLEWIPDQSRTIVRPPQERELWNPWWVFAALLGLGGVEWLVRRSNDIA